MLDLSRFTAAPVREEGGAVRAKRAGPGEAINRAVGDEVITARVLESITADGWVFAHKDDLATREEVPVIDAHPFVQSHSVALEGCCKVCGRTEDAHHEAPAEAGTIYGVPAHLSSEAAYGWSCGYEAALRARPQASEGGLSTLAELHAAERLIDQQAAEIRRLKAREEAQPVAWPEAWSGPCTVGNMIANLKTLPPEMPLYTAYHIPMDGEPSLLKVKRPTLSRERVDGTNIKTGDESVPYSAVIWTEPRDFGEATTPPAPEAEKLRVAVEGLLISARHRPASTSKEMDRWVENSLNPAVAFANQALSALQQERCEVTAWAQYRNDFEAMTDAEIEYETRRSQDQLDEAESWLEAVAAWKAAGRPRALSAAPGEAGE
ncbi:hypothetical protein [uncultured Brevundimonas sp.]|uniref:hypothetical protein n=1 Tax=uncultured Brevundimonas sp. TaxID=213418 RepID=UPI002629B427|nr:hypothetical protein [uncultured Brevundimonas sp.]